MPEIDNNYQWQILLIKYMYYFYKVKFLNE